MKDALGELWNYFLTSFIKGEWLGSLIIWGQRAYDLTKFLTYLCSIIMLVGFGALSLGTLTYLLAEGFGIQLSDLETIHHVTKDIITNETAWAAFAILIANVTFISRSRANEIQQAALSLQQEKWYYEKSKIVDEHYAYRSKKSNCNQIGGMGNINTRQPSTHITSEQHIKNK